MNMYHNKFVVAIKHNGKVLREIGDVVKLPFGSEFTVLVKNLNSRRAKFKLHIDGTDVLDGTEIVVNANSESEIKRFLRNGNMTTGNALKFIERTQQIEDGPRGIKADDGIVRVEYWFEQELPEVKTVYHKDVWWPDNRRWYGPTFGPMIGSTNDVGGTLGSIFGNIVGATSSALYSATSDQGYESQANVTHENAVGITVPGSRVEQKFTTVYGFIPEAQSHVIILRLVGKTENDVKVVAPVTVKTKNICSTCSHTNKHNAKFCSQCGTALDIV